MKRNARPTNLLPRHLTLDLIIVFAIARPSEQQTVLLDSTISLSSRPTIRHSIVA